MEGYAGTLVTITLKDRKPDEIESYSTFLREKTPKEAMKFIFGHLDGFVCIEPEHPDDLDPDVPSVYEQMVISIPHDRIDCIFYEYRERVFNDEGKLIFHDPIFKDSSGDFIQMLED